MTAALFPHHDWSDADGLEEPDPVLAQTGYFRNDPDAYSTRLRGWHQLVWSKEIPGVGNLDLQPRGHGLRDAGHGEYLSSDAAVPVWERWREVQGFHAATQEVLRSRGRGSIHDVGWRLYDMGGMVLFPGFQVDGLWTINQAKGCMRARIGDRLDLTLECIRLYYEHRRSSTDEDVALPDGYDRVNPLGPVLHRYRSFFELFDSFDGYVRFWLLDDLVVTTDTGLQVNFLLPRTSAESYDFVHERALPTDRNQYAGYLVAADDFVDRRNRRMAQEAARLGIAARLGRDICPACLTGGDAHRRGWR
jgi:hypothetical protein